ncbi:hypothetical protein AB0O72_33370 [Streptomyces sp. NPDC088106]|uniref:hypothetical protein n=1 Tax=Streptomyces sp. NPDC088106 TaxID=3154867 RepID=UPI00343949DE
MPEPLIRVAPAGDEGELAPPDRVTWSRRHAVTPPPRRRRAPARGTGVGAYVDNV